MPRQTKLPLGFQSALSVLKQGRAAYFGAENHDLPQKRAATIALDDMVPQFGYVGVEYSQTRVLMIGINPGNGPNHARTSGDEVMMPPLHKFVVDHSVNSFLEAQRAYQVVCESWPMWKRHCSEVIGAGRLRMDEIAFTNCLPWRTASESKFSDQIAKKAAKLYAYPVIEELKPKVVIAMGKCAAKILSLGGQDVPDLIVWNRAQAATQAVLRERAETAARILNVVGRDRPLLLQPC
jgi:hypothetical protein